MSDTQPGRGNPNATAELCKLLANPDSGVLKHNSSRGMCDAPHLCRGSLLQ